MTVTQQSLISTVFFKTWICPFCHPWKNQIPSANSIWWGSSCPLFSWTTASPEHRAEVGGTQTPIISHSKNLDGGTTEGGKEEERSGIHVDRTTVTTVKDFLLFITCKILISGDQTSRSKRRMVGAHLTQGYKTAIIWKQPPSNAGKYCRLILCVCPEQFWKRRACWQNSKTYRYSSRIG